MGRDIPSVPSDSPKSAQCESSSSTHNCACPSSAGHVHHAGASNNAASSAAQHGPAHSGDREKTEEELEAEARYEEAMEEEYARREGGA